MACRSTPVGAWSAGVDRATFTSYVFPIIVVLLSVGLNAIANSHIRFAPDRARARQGVMTFLVKIAGVGAICSMLYDVATADELTKGVAFKMSFAMCGAVLLIVVELYERMLDHMIRAIDRQIDHAQRTVERLQAREGQGVTRSAPPGR